MKRNVLLFKKNSRTGVIYEEGIGIAESTTFKVHYMRNYMVTRME